MKNFFKNLMPMLLLVAGLGISPNAWGYDWTSGKYIYYNDQNANISGTIHIRVGKGENNDNYTNDYTMTNISNTKLYYMSIPSWGGYHAFHIANNCGWTGGNSIYKVNTGDSYKITKSSEFQKYSVSSDILLTLKSSGSTSDDCTYYKTTKTSVSGYSDLNKSQSVEIYVSTNGGTSYSNVTSSLSTYGSVSATYYTMSSKTAATQKISQNIRDNSQSAALSSSITLSASANTGYTFKGFSNNSATKPSSTSSTYNYTVSDATTTRVYFAANTYTVTLDAQGGTDGSANVTATYGSDMPTATMPTRTGYTFGGYYDEEDGAGTQYYNNTGASVRAWDKASDATLYAKWTEKTHNITISNDGHGTTNPSGEKSAVGEVTGIEIIATPATDYGFKEWVYSGGSVKGQTATTTFYPTADNATIKATFQSTAVYYTWAFGVHSSGGGNVSSNVAAGSSVRGGTAITLTATPNTGYEVDGWYDNQDCTGQALQTGQNTYSFTISGNSVRYVKFKEKTFSVTVQAGTGIDQVTGGGANVGQLTGTAITATVKSGYTWSTWTGGTGTYENGATVKDNTFRPTAASTLTATATENKYNVTINTNLSAGASLKFGSTAKDWGSVANVGIDSKQSITVTLNAGYKYNGAFSVTGGARVSGSGSSFTVWADGADGTITVNIAEDLSSNWYLAGTSPMFPNGWNTGETNMMKRATGHSTENVYYFTIHVDDKDIKGSGQESTYQFKIHHYKAGDGGCDEWFGWGNTEGSNYWVNQTCTTGIYKGENNLYFIPTVAGDYEFKVDATNGSSVKLTVTWPIYNCVYGEFDSWNKDTHKLEFAGGDEASTVVNITDVSKSYQFLVLVNSNYLTNNTSFTTPITRSTASNVAFAAKGGSDNNAKFTPDIAGDYTFTYNKSTNKLTITYPALPTASTSSTEKRIFEEGELSFISGEGTEANPYKIYTDEALTIDITALTAQTNLTAKYQFGEEAATTDVLSKTITNPSTTKTSILVKAFYESDGVAGTAWEKTIYYQGVTTPTIALSTTQNEYDILTAPDEVMISYRATNYTGTATIARDDNDTWQTPSSDSEDYTDDLGGTVQAHTYKATATENGRTFTSTLVVSVYKMVKVKVADENSLFTHFYMWRDGMDQTGPAWPGETFSYQVGTTHIFYVKYPTFDRFVLNNGKAPEEQDAAQTVDIVLPEDDACYAIGTQDQTSKKYACTTADCPNGLYVKDIDPVAALVGEGVLVSPQVDIEPGLDESSLTITFDYKTATGISCDQRGRSFMVTATQAAGETQTIEVTYSIEGAESVTKQVQINVTEAIMIQAKYGNLGWADHNRIFIHYWGKGVDGTINMTWKDYVGEDPNKQDRVYARIPLDSDHEINFQIYAWNMDDDKQWHITKDVTGVTTSGCYTITSDGENKRRNITRDDGGLCWTAYYVEVDMNNGTVYRSNTVESSTETVSFFAPGEGETGYKQGLVRIMENGTPKGEVASPTFTTSGVYTATITAGGAGLDNVAPYTGDYYIRTDGASGRWDHYKEADKDNKFTKFDKIETSTYDRYWVKNLKVENEGDKQNLQACVANDYNENLANKIVSSSYTDANGDVKPDVNGVNVRFGYDPSTNNFERAIIMGAASNAFLNVIGDNVYKEKACTTLLNTQNEDSKFEDKEQWVYEKDVYVKIGDGHTHSAAKLQSKDFNGNVMYQLGFTIDPNTGKTTNTPKTFGLIAVGTSEGTYKIHLVYDFKTNRMVSGWTPEGEISGNIVLDADMLLVRKHQDNAQQIRFSNGGASISKIKHLYGVMEIEKEKMTAAASANMYELHLYWISFPFDVKVSSIFGVGTYGKEWKLQRYDGAERASKGWFKGDGTTTFWKDMTLDETMNANEGYILSLKPAEFDKETCEIWNHGRTVAAFYFPSVLDNVGLIKAATYEQNVPEHECKINREFMFDDKPQNHTITDSHWNVMGIPAFQDAVPTTYEQGFHAVYKWVPSTNTYTVQEVNSEFPLQTMYAYMVQYHGTINWTNVSVISKAPYTYADDKNYTIELFFNGNGAEDHTYINLADEASTDFVLNEDMMKLDNAGFPNIYSFAGNYNVAYNETKMENQTVILGVSAPKNGSYTFAMPKDFSGKAVLVDLESGEATDLNLSNYTVELNKGTYNNRFQLLLEVEAKAPTAIDNAKGEWNEDGKTKKLFINDNIYLINAGRIYNASGTKVR